MTRTRVKPEGIVAAADKVLGRASAGPGAVEEIACTAAGRALIDDADAAAQRATLGLGSISLQNANSVAITGGSIVGGSITGIVDLAVADGGTGASDAATARTNLGLSIGTNVQAQNTNLQAIAGQTTAADRMTYWTGSGTAALATLTSFARAILDDSSASTVRATISCPQGSASHLQLSYGTDSNSIYSDGSTFTTFASQDFVTPAIAGYGYLRTRAWANFDGVNNDNLTGTYTQTGTTVIVTITSPSEWSTYGWDGMQVDHQVFAVIGSGTSTGGLYAVTATPENNASLSGPQFQYTAPNVATPTSGTITIRRCVIRQSNGIASVADVGVGDYVVNLKDLPDANYSVLLNGQRGDNSTFGYVQLRATANNTMNQGARSFRILSSNSAGGALDYPLVNVAVFR